MGWQGSAFWLYNPEKGADLAVEPFRFTEENVKCGAAVRAMGPELACRGARHDSLARRDQAPERTHP